VERKAVRRGHKATRLKMRILALAERGGECWSKRREFETS
jgi:hypothetical protein